MPRFGETIAFSESSATPFVNSVYGARSNCESAQSALCSAVTGRDSGYGFLLDENRAGEVLVHVEADMKDDFDYQMLGYLTPRKTEFAVPVFEGITGLPLKEAPMNLGAELMGGNVALTTSLALRRPHSRSGLPGQEAAERGHDHARPELDASGEELRARAAKSICPLRLPAFQTIDQVTTVAEMVKGQNAGCAVFHHDLFADEESGPKMGYEETGQGWRLNIHHRRHVHGSALLEIPLREEGHHGLLQISLLHETPSDGIRHRPLKDSVTLPWKAAIEKGE